LIFIRSGSQHPLPQIIFLAILRKGDAIGRAYINTRITFGMWLSGRSPAHCARGRAAGGGSGRSGGGLSGDR